MDDIERLVAIEEIRQLKARYFRCMDTKDWDGFQAVFADDASMDTTQEAPNIEVVVGAPQIRQFVEGSVGPVVTTHHGHMPEITFLSDTEAEGVWAMEDYVQIDPPSGRISLNGFGHYMETYRKGDDGQWRISSKNNERLRVDDAPWTLPDR